jgi:hypothetical protein
MVWDGTASVPRDRAVVSGVWVQIAAAARSIRRSPSRAVAAIEAVLGVVALVRLPWFLPWDEGTGAVIYVSVFGVIVFAVVAYLAYRMWFRPSRVIVAILFALLLGTWTFTLATGDPWEWWAAAIGVVEVMLLVMAWNEPRVV